MQFVNPTACVTCCCHSSLVRLSFSHPSIGILVHCHEVECGWTVRQRIRVSVAGSSETHHSTGIWVCSLQRKFSSIWFLFSYRLTNVLKCFINIWRHNEYIFAVWRCQSYGVAYLLTPWSRVLPEKLTGFQLVKKFAFYGTRRFITAFTSARHLFLSWARSIQSMPPHTTSWRSILMLFFHLHLGLSSDSFPQVSPPEPCIHLSFPPYMLHDTPILFFSTWSPEKYRVRSTDHWASRMEWLTRQKKSSWETCWWILSKM